MATDAAADPAPLPPTQEFWLRLLCYVMETDHTEALTPICISLTNLVERQPRTKDVEASVASKSRHGGQRPCAGWGAWAGRSLRVSECVLSPFSRKRLGVQTARPEALSISEEGLKWSQLPLAGHSSHPFPLHPSQDLTHGGSGFLHM